jgi:acetyl esterase
MALRGCTAAPPLFAALLTLFRGRIGRVGTDEGVLDPWVADWFAANPMFVTPLPNLSREVLELARSPIGGPPTRDIAKVTDDVVAGVPVRLYQHDTTSTGVVVYFHGGGFCIGSIGLMDSVARELAHSSGATVVSVEYRLAPEHPFPAGLDDCVAVTRWASANAARLGVDPSRVAVAGESAGGNLSAAVALRLRDAGDTRLAAQVLLYPVLDSKRASYASRAEFDGIVINWQTREMFHDAYAGENNIDDDQYALPIRADSLTGLPAAMLVLGGCDPLRDEGRAYAQRLREDNVAVDELCCAGQPHGFLNFGFPAAAEAFARIGAFLRSAFAEH